MLRIHDNPDKNAGLDFRNNAFPKKCSTSFGNFLYFNISRLEAGLSPRIVRQTHAVLRNALKHAAKWQLLPKNPAEYVDLPQAEADRDTRHVPR